MAGLTAAVLLLSGVGELVAGLAELLFSGLVEVAVPLIAGTVAPVLGVATAVVESELVVWRLESCLVIALVCKLL